MSVSGRLTDALRGTTLAAMGRRTMNHRLRATLAASASLLVVLAACAKRDRVVTVADDDAEMTAAIARARETLPHFWTSLERPQPGDTDFALKVRISDARGVEHFWANDPERRDGAIFGTIGNDPALVAKVKLGDRIEIPAADISDWTFMRGGKIHGNYTLRPLLKHLPADEAARFRSVLADP